MYNLSAMENILILRSKVLNILRNKLEGFFLAGGTALSLYYFEHRESYDLDFFTRDFSSSKIKGLISVIGKSFDIDVKSERKTLVKGEADMIVCHIPVDKNKAADIDDNKTYLKIDFIQDVYRDVVSNDRVVNDIPVMSIENIYLRKIYALCGVFKMEDDTGRKKFIGGRQEAKDFFDLYYLSQRFKDLSTFVVKHCSADEIESIINWHRTYDRLAMMGGIADVITEQKTNYKIMVMHFDAEVKSIIKYMVE
jgi:predicted nucleotidyltransferase component of viral defense system